MKHLFALGLALTQACSHAHATLPIPARGSVTPPTTLGNDDVFEMRVYGEDGLSGTYRVAADGTVSVPLAGSVVVAGMTPAQAAEAIASQLQAYLQRPHVSVFVKEYNSKKIYVFGEVKNPGTFSYSPGMSIVQAITLAGGFDKLADKGGALVNRLVDGREERLRVSVTAIGEGRQVNFELRPGDLIYIPETFF